LTQLLPFLSIFIAMIGAFAPMMPAFIPMVGLMPLYRMRHIRAALIITAWVLAIAACVNAPESFAALPFVFIFTIPTIVLEPQRIFIPLVDPKHVPASQANIRGEDLVLGYADGEHAAAWPFETLVPRHLINDQFKDEPLLVAY
jgi:hypothetical protein